MTTLDLLSRVTGWALPILNDLPQPIEVVGELARAQLLALDAFVLLALERGSQHFVHALGLHHCRAVRVEHHHIAEADPRAAHRHRLVERPNLRLVRALHPYPARPYRQAHPRGLPPPPPHA